MKKILFFLFLIPFFLNAQQARYNGWLLNGNGIGTNPFFAGTRDNTSLFFRSNIASNIGYVKYDSLGNFIWMQNVASRPESKIQFSDLINAGFGVPAFYIGVKSPTTYNYGFWSDSLITRYNGPQTIRLCSTDIPLFTGSGANPNGNNGSYITFNSINTATATLSSNKTHIFIGGCTWGFAGTPTVTPIKIAIQADTYSATIASTVAYAITMDVPAPIASTNITITTPLALRVSGASNFNGNSYFGGAASSVTTPSALVHIAAGDASTPALKFTTQTAPSSPNNGEVWFNGSTFTFQGSKTLSGNNITVGTSSVGSTFTVSGGSTLNGITNTGNITTSGTYSCGSTFTSTGILKATAGILGSATNDAATTGNVGENSSSLIASGSAITLTTTVTTNITSISLTAGDWDISGNVTINETTSTVTERVGGITSTSATVPSDGSEIYNGNLVTLLSGKNTISIPRKRFSLSTTTTVYLVVKCTFSAGTEVGYGTIWARRIR